MLLFLGKNIYYYYQLLVDTVVIDADFDREDHGVKTSF
jgi:hypothetical protein